MVVDIETDSLENPTKIHCIACCNLETNEVTLYKEDWDEFRKQVRTSDCIIGHNFIDFDYDIIRNLLGIEINQDKIVDTLILSKLHDYRQPGGHSLENWGNLLAHPKVGIDIKNWTQLTPQIEERCKNDARLTAMVFRVLDPILRNAGFGEAIQAEHKMQFICLDMHRNGFGFDADRARSLHSELSRRVELLDRELLDAFPPKARSAGVVVPKLTKRGTISRSNMRWYDGTDWTIFTPGHPFTRIQWEQFNPQSPTQIVERLNQAGWNPTVKTDSGESWKVNEENLSTLPSDAPVAARRLVERLMLASRVRKLEEWLKAYNTNTGRIHGRFVSLGTWTHRMAHRKPNMGNVSAEKSIKYKGKELYDEALRLGGEMRQLWIASPGSYLVGCDIDAAHLRIFAHLIEDKELIEALENGKKEDGTDPHSRNQDRIGKLCTSRDTAKTCVYTFLNGGGAPKFASILGCSYDEGKRSLDRFVESYPGLRSLRNKEIPRLARQGYFVGLDGRRVLCDSEHLMLAAILQNAEKVLLTYAVIEMRRRFKEQGLRFKHINIVHDDTLFETPSLKEAEEIKRIGVDCVYWSGEKFRMRCPMRGEAKIGTNWKDAH